MLTSRAKTEQNLFDASRVSLEMRSTLFLSALHCRILRDRNKNLFQAPHGDAMNLFMWQDDIIGVARFTDACLTGYTHHLALPWDPRHLMSLGWLEKM